MKSSKAAIGLILISVICCLASGAHAAQILDSGMSPSEGTSNSVYEYYVVFQDDPTPPTTPMYPISVVLEIDRRWATGWTLAYDPSSSAGFNMYYNPGQTLRDGIRYSFRVSSGLCLNMPATDPLPFAGPPYLPFTQGFYPNVAVYHQTTPTDNTWKRVIGCFDTDRDARRFGLEANGDGSPKNHGWRIFVTWQGPPNANGEIPDPQVLVTSGSGPTVHDSFAGSFGADVIDRYGGRRGDRDHLYSFSIGYPNSIFCDPLSVEPYQVQFPDEGTCSSTYNFRVHYWNEDGLKPGVWLPGSSDLWGINNYENGVLMYIRNLDKPITDSTWGRFQPHFMYVERPGESVADTDYILRVIPIGQSITHEGANHMMTTWAYTSSTNHYYEALPPGRYEYYFACSDDVFTAFGGDRDAFFRYMEDQVNIGSGMWSSVPTPLPPNDRVIGSNCINPKSSSHADPYYNNTTGYYGFVDKRTYMPGAWIGGYPYDSWQGSSLDVSRQNVIPLPISYRAFTYPQVDPGLFEVGPHSSLVGGARFLGTLHPYKRAVIPSVPGQGAGSFRMWSESAGGTTQDVFTFRVNYWQSQGVAPSYVRMYVNNSWNPDDGGFVSYDMLPEGGSTPTTAELRSGATYYVMLSGGQLGRGPHCYYFEAADQTWDDNRYLSSAGKTLTVGAKTTRYPRRPETIKYNQPGVGEATFYDTLLPQQADPDSGLPLENDVINGPFINTRPQLVSGSWSVTPSSGSAGTEFVFRVRYRDDDNQRPYVPWLIIETDDTGNTYTASMVRAPDSDVPGNSLAQFSDATGVVYQWRSSSNPGLRLSPGNRRFKFDFMDDWGRQIVADDRIAGEHIASTDMNWKGSFVVTGNRAPTLSAGSVTSADGTSNETTVWNYRVTYSDPDENAPAYIIVYVGRQDSPASQIVWDSGNAMYPANDQDTVYADGREYIFTTRLPGDNDQPIKYYSCFVASDGIEPAEYNSVSSPSSGMIWKSPETLSSVSGSPVIFSTAHYPLVTDVPESSQELYPTNYLSPIIYDSSGMIQIQGSDYSLDNVTGTVTFLNLGVPPTQPVKALYWFGTAPDPVSGPAAVTGNHPPTLTLGQVIPQSGSSTDTFTYSVTYTDIDGQSPLYVNAVVDGIRHPMAAVGGSTTYKSGVEYRCQTMLTTGSHQFYFEASDGAALALFDNDNSNSTVDPISGPYINDRPVFVSVGVTPGGTIDASQPVTYTATYMDNDNDAPMTGYPIVYVDNPDEEEWNGTAAYVGDDFLFDNYQTDWTADQFKGMPVEVTVAGTSQRFVYKIASNTSSTDPLEPNRLYLITSGLNDTVIPGSQFSVGKLTMDKQDPTDQVYTNGVVFEAKVPSLGTGTHKAHFVALVDEQVRPSVYQQYTLRSPATGDLDGPTVVAQAPAGNHAPTLTQPTVTPRTGTTGTSFRFSVVYADADGDSPVDPHDQTKGYIRMKIEESAGVWVTYDLSLPAPDDPDYPGVPNYTVGAEFRTTISGLSLGAHNYYFEASDGWTSVRSPAAAPAMHTVYVSRPPVLLQGLVDPTSGNVGRVYEYRVKYRDPDGDPPLYLRLIIDNGTPIDIGVPVPGADYSQGVVYTYPLLKGQLSEALHNFYFEASDGNGYAWYDQDVRDQENASDPDPHKNSTSSAPPSPIRPIDGPSVHSNTAPQLSNATVSPPTGFDLETFVYSVTYNDSDGDEPEYVECYIDTTNPPSPGAASYRMTKNPNQSDYVAGVTYTLSKDGLSPGSHTYYFKASDWLDTTTYPATPSSGPTVATRSAATISISVPSAIAIGDSATVTGTATGYAGAPLVGIPIKLVITRPDGVAISPQPTVTTNGAGQYTYPSGATPWKPSLTGTWRVQATWVGNSQYLASASLERTMSVAGPSYAVSGLDMISVPLQPLSSFPDGVFGATPPFALAKWLPARIDYRLYSLLPGIRTDIDFPAIAPGQSYWIKTLVAKTLAPTGSLVDPFSDYSVPLYVGWNQVGCPFTTDILWSTLRVRRTLNGVTSEVDLATAAANGWIREYGWTYDTSTANYKLVDATRAGAERYMRPWRGYWVKAMINCTLVIPGPSRATRSSDGSPAYSLTSAEGEGDTGDTRAKWQVQLIAKNGNLRDDCNYVGMSRSGDERIESPGIFQNYVNLSISDSKGRAYASDLRAKVSTGTTWKVNVATDQPGDVEISWEGLQSLPSGAKLMISDSDGKSVWMTSGDSFKFAAQEGQLSREFEITYEQQ